MTPWQLLLLVFGTSPRNFAIFQEEQATLLYKKCKKKVRRVIFVIVTLYSKGAFQCICKGNVLNYWPVSTPDNRENFRPRDMKRDKILSWGDGRGTLVHFAVRSQTFSCSTLHNCFSCWLTFAAYLRGWTEVRKGVLSCFVYFATSASSSVASSQTRDYYLCVLLWKGGWRKAITFVRKAPSWPTFCKEE